jgi:hypothetical protein
MTEIDALKTIDDVLAGLDDVATRDRVLRWACQKYLVGTPPLALGTDQRIMPNLPAMVPLAKPKGKFKAKASSAASPSIVRDLNLKPKGRVSFDQFAVQKKPGSNQHKCVVAVYYLRHELGLSLIAVDHVYTCFKHMQWRVPSRLANTMAYVSSVHGWLDTRNMGDIKLTTIGENLVEHDLPRSSKKGSGS